MPHETVWERRGIHWKFHGHVTFLEVLEANDELYNDARFDDHDYQIWDGSDIESMDLETEDADVPASADKATNILKPYLKCALIATRPEVRENVQRYIDTSIQLGSTWEFRLFDNLDDARQWAMS